MFGSNSQDNSQSNNPVVNDYDSALPVGGEDLLAAGPMQNNVQNNDVASMPPSAPYQGDLTDGSMSSPMPAPNPSSPVDNSADSGLLSIKQDALQQLKPLVGKLEQSPEEKFRTTMMMIQASDDKSLLNEAYQQAQQIPDEKVKAQALLDVVNEINYFTQQESQ
jgi:hypothetical protein